MKISFSDLLVPAIIVGGLGWWGYHTWSDRTAAARAELARQQQSAEYQSAVGAMASRHGATAALTDKLADAGHTYTFNVQNALLASTGRAVTFGATVTDLKKSEGAYVLDLDDAGTAVSAIHYTLECDAPTAQKIIGANPAITRVMVVATITAVDKTEAATTTSSDPAHYVAKGRCLELVAR